MTTSLHNRIFTETGCVSRDKLIAYTENRLTGKDRHHIERHLLDCPLCMDAVDGFAGKTEVAGLLSDLDARVDAMSGWHNKGAFNYRMLAAAAVAAIILSGAVLWFFNNNQKQMAVVVKDDVLTEKPEPDDQQEVQQKKDAALTETAISASALSRDVAGKEETEAESGALSVDGYASGEATY
ncbi:MAG: zf-HC2 domain-containing protein, partial [Flavobacteriales bacterium]